MIIPLVSQIGKLNFKHVLLHKINNGTNNAYTDLKSKPEIIYLIISDLQSNLHMFLSIFYNTCFFSFVLEYIHKKTLIIAGKTMSATGNML